MSRKDRRYTEDDKLRTACRLEELALMYREIAHQYERTLSEQLQDQLAAAAPVIDQVEREMKDLGIIAKQHDV